MKKRFRDHPRDKRGLWCGAAIFRRAFCALLLVSLSAGAQGQQPRQDLTETSLEALMNIQVTSASKKQEKLSQTAAAIFVITQEDIRHSGATSIPEILRMVPGLDVAQINANTWGISSRGFNAQHANKLLVLIDGRTVYTPMFSGVYWGVQDLVLEDIERIEVIRGPGATVWGANAVNGVINIITKKASDTQGGLLTGGAGNIEHGLASARYGGKLGKSAAYRIFSRYSNENHLLNRLGQSGDDGSDLLHGGFRVDGSISTRDSLTVQGDMYEGSEGSLAKGVELAPPSNLLLNDRTYVSGGNVLTRWNHTFSPHSDTSLQIYFDRYARRDLILGEGDNAFDIDFQHHVGWGNRQDFVWGLGYRYWSDATNGSVTTSFNPAAQGSQLFSSFIQDEITLKPDRLYLSVGAKIEHNDYTGFEFQPSARITWNAAERHMFWAGYSRARRTPSRADRGLQVQVGLPAFSGQGGVPVLLTLLGSSGTVSENLDAFEVGYRTQLRANISLDLTAFYNRYGDLQTLEPATPFFESNPPPPHVNVPIVFGNMMHGETHGLEMAVNWKVTDRWTLSPGYAFERIHLHTSPTSQHTQSVLAGEGGRPHHQAQLRSNLALPRGFEWNTSVYFVGRLPAQQVPSYTRLDTGITWQASDRLSFSLVGQNLLKDHHLEFNSSDQSVKSSLIKRSVYAKLTWQF